MKKHLAIKPLGATNSTFLSLINYQHQKPNKTLFLHSIIKIFHWPISTRNDFSLNLNSKQKRNRIQEMKLFTTNNLQSLTLILFNTKTLKHIFLTRILEIWHGPPENTNWLLPDFKTWMDTIKSERGIKWKSSCKVDLKCLYLDQFIKNSTKIQFLKLVFEKYIGTLLTRKS